MSGIYIPGKGVPERCDRCMFDDGVYCHAYPPSENMIYNIEDGKPDWCPIIPVPDHGRLIDADELDYSNTDLMGNHIVYAVDLERAMTIIPATEKDRGR